MKRRPPPLGHPASTPPSAWPVSGPQTGDPGKRGPSRKGHTDHATCRKDRARSTNVRECRESGRRGSPNHAAARVPLRSLKFREKNDGGGINTHYEAGKEVGTSRDASGCLSFPVCVASHFISPVKQRSRGGARVCAHTGHLQL